MNVNVENTSSLGRKIEFTIPKETVAQKEEKKLNDVAKTASIKGFRKGKVPKNLLKSRYGADLKKEIIGQLIEDQLKQYIEKEDLKLADRPEIEEILDKADEDLKFTVKCELLPTIELKDYSEISAEKLIVDITDADIDKAIEKYKNSFASYKKKDTAIKAVEGDKLIIDFVGYLDDKPFDNGSGNDVSLELGSNSFIPGFEKGLIGAKASENRDLNLTFPKDYGNAELAGKKVLFKVTVKSVEGKVLPELDEEFAKKLNIKDGNKDKIRDKVKENLEESVRGIVETKLRDSVLESFAKINSIEIPPSLLEKEKKNMHEELQRKNAVGSMNEEELDKEAKKRVSLILLLNEVVTKHNIKPDPERVRAKVMESAALFGQSEYIEKLYYESEELMRGIQNIVVSDQATDLLLEKAKVTEKKSTFDEIIKPEEK